MAKKQASRETASERSVTEERAVRLYRLLQLLAEGPQTRGNLTKRLRLDIRGFYRDLEMLRLAGIAVSMDESRYSLDRDWEEAVALLPLPDPRLTLGEARVLAKGQGKAHRKLRDYLARITGPRGRKPAR
jgi:hypothetical protein